MAGYDHDGRCGGRENYTGGVLGAREDGWAGGLWPLQGCVLLWSCFRLLHCIRGEDRQLVGME